MDKKLKSFLTGLGIGALITIAVIFFNREQDYNLAQRLSDGFFVPAVLLLGFGGIVLAKNKGTFDMAAYSIKSVFHIHYPGASIGSPLSKEEFADYRERKAKERQKKSPNGILLAGLVYLVLATIMLIAYFCV